MIKTILYFTILLLIITHDRSIYFVQDRNNFFFDEEIQDIVPEKKKLIFRKNTIKKNLVKNSHNYGEHDHR